MISFQYDDGAEPDKNGEMPVISNSFPIFGGIASTRKGALFAWRAFTTDTRMPIPVLSM
jgi:hypothetical protein